jgi:diaminopimelate epimerase
VVAACLEGRARPGVEIPVHLPGGTLGITVAAERDGTDPSLTGVLMRGPAETVFEAEVDTARAIHAASSV